MDTIGVFCEPDHPVFGRVAERLAARGFGVEFLPPGEPVPDETIDDLSALVNTVLTRQSFAALRYADGVGVETWNGFVPTTALSSRLLALDALGSLGCRVPDASTRPLEVGNRPLRRFRWDGPTDADSVFYRELVGAESDTYRYYAVDDGVETHVQALSLRSSLTEHRSILGEADVDVTLATRVRELIDRFSARAVSVDFVDGGDGYYAVDVDPSPDFFAAEMERRIADSIASLTTIGA